MASKESVRGSRGARDATHFQCDEGHAFTMCWEERRRVSSLLRDYNNLVGNYSLRENKNWVVAHGQHLSTFIL